MVFLDTDLVVGVLRRDEDAMKKVAELEQRGETIRTTAVNAYELLKGAAASSRSEENLRMARRLLSSMQVHAVTSSSAEAAATVYVSLKRRGKMIGEFDLLIAGVVLGSAEKLLTRDEHFRDVPGLRLDRW